MNNLALQALADIRLHPGLATNLAFNAGSARTLLKFWKPNLLRVLHPDAGGDKLQIDYGLVSAAFDILEEINDEELCEMLRFYGSIFTDATGTILALKQQLTVEVPQLKSTIEELKIELEKYKSNETWLIEQNIRENDKFTVEMVDKIVQTLLVHSSPTELPNNLRVKEEVKFHQAPEKYLISEISPMRQGVEVDTQDEASDLQFIGVPYNGLYCHCISVGPSGRTTVSSMLIFPPLTEEELKQDTVTEREYNLSIRELDELLQNSLKENEHIASGHTTVVTGVLIGFLNPIEANDAFYPELINDLSSHFVYRRKFSLREVADLVLPLLTNNGLIREHLDPSDNEPLKCRVRQYDPKNTFSSTYAVILSSTQVANDWEVTFVPLGMTWEK